MKKFAIGGGLLGLATLAHASYADADAVVTATVGIPTGLNTAFVAAAAIGLGILIVKLTARVVKRGISL